MFQDLRAWGPETGYLVPAALLAREPAREPVYCQPAASTAGRLRPATVPEKHPAAVDCVFVEPGRDHGVLSLELRAC